MKCTLCDKEFKDNVSDFDLVQHFINEHKGKVKEIGKVIIKSQIKLTGKTVKTNKVVK